MSADEAPSLFERVTNPSIPKGIGRQISQLEQEFVRAEIEQLRKQIPVLRPLYARRNALVASKELQEADFWPRVFANAPQEVDEYILASDAAVIGQCLKNLTVERCDVDENGNGGDPRSVRFTFEFATGEENPYFTDAQLVKEFHYRTKVTQTPKGKRHVWEGYVSTPVRIHWKKDQDLTKGLLDAACDLYEAEQKKGAGVDRTSLPEFEKLLSKVDEADAENDALIGDDDEEADDENVSSGISFFNFFGYRGNSITAEESAKAEKEELERWQKIEKGEKVEGDDDDDEDDDDDDVVDEEESLAMVEIFPAADDIAVALAEDVWPNALKYYVQSYEVADDFDDEMDIEELDDDEEDEDEDEEQDGNGPPAKKAKK